MARTKGAKTTPRKVREYVIAQALSGKQRSTSPEVLAKAIRKELEEDWDLSYVPSWETLQDIIQEARRHPVSPLDEQWSVACLAQNDIPPEALPAVLHIYEKRQRQSQIDFTIREVLWIARLYRTIDAPGFLELFASRYALRDKIDWILGNPPNTRGFDFVLLNYVNPGRRDEVIANFAESPGYLNPFPSSTSEAEVQEKLKRKGYEIETPGMVALNRHVKEVWQQVLQVTKQGRAQLEQIKPEELTLKQARYLKWARRFIKVQEANHERAHSQEG